MTPTNMTLMPKTATVLSPPMSQESEKLVKMKNRKMKKQARKDVKNVKQVIVTEGVTDEYNIDNILEELGEVGRNVLKKTRLRFCSYVVQWNLDLRKPDLRKIVATTKFLVHK